MQPSSVKGSNGVYRVQSEINVTPLVDVMLVLLIIFMVTAPMMSEGLHVSLPQAKATQKLDPKPPVVLTVTKDGQIGIDSQTLAPEAAIAAVEARLGDDRSQPIQLRADKEANYGDVVGFLGQLAAHGLTRIAILTGPASAPKTDLAPTSDLAPAPK